MPSGCSAKADGAPSFVTILGIRLPFPGVQLGFGFAISGVGGLVGINRRVDTECAGINWRPEPAFEPFCVNASKNARTVIEVRDFSPS